MSDFTALYGGGSVPVGSIVRGNLAGNSDYLPCNGTTYLRSAYPALNKTNMQALNSTLTAVPSSTFASLATPGTMLSNGTVVIWRSAVNDTRYLTTSDGVTWTDRTMPQTNTSISVANGIFFAYPANATSGPTTFHTSPDGVNWTARSITLSSSTFQRFGFIGGLYTAFVIGGSAGGYWTSPDLVTWTSRPWNSAGTNLVSVGATIQSYGRLSVIPGLGMFITTTEDTGGTRLLNTQDGLVWNPWPSSGLRSSAVSFTSATLISGITGTKVLGICEGAFCIFDTNYMFMPERILNSVGGGSIDSLENIFFGNVGTSALMSDDYGITFRVLQLPTTIATFARLGNRIIYGPQAGTNVSYYVDMIDTSRFKVHFSSDGTSPNFIKAR